GLLYMSQLSTVRVPGLRNGRSAQLRNTDAWVARMRGTTARLGCAVHWRAPSRGVALCSTSARLGYPPEGAVARGLVRGPRDEDADTQWPRHSRANGHSEATRLQARR